MHFRVFEDDSGDVYSGRVAAEDETSPWTAEEEGPEIQSGAAATM